MHSDVLKTYHRPGFIAEINRKWQKKYEAEQAWLNEMSDL